MLVQKLTPNFYQNFPVRFFSLQVFTGKMVDTSWNVMDLEDCNVYNVSSWIWSDWRLNNGDALVGRITNLSSPAAVPGSTLSQGASQVLEAIEPADLPKLFPEKFCPNA